MKHRWIRWVPAVAVPAVIATGVIVVPLAAGAADLPVKSPADVIRLVAASDTKTFSGTVEQSSELGLPSLPAVSGSSASSDSSSAGEQSALELLTGDHTAKVYVDGATRQRVQVLDQLAERDAVRNGSDVWLYDSKAQSATHVTLPDRSPSGTDGATPTPLATTPQALADKLLAAADPSTTVTLGAPSSVAGRDAYSLVLTPKTDATLVGSVRIAVDGATGIPLRVQVIATGATAPAFEAGFTTFSTDRPDASVFRFTPPANAKVTEQSVPERSAAKATEHGDHPKPQVTGEGWASIATLPAGSAPASLTTDPLFAQLTTSVAGGRALSTSLVSVLVTADGRVLVGAVPVSALQAAAQ
ncbi:outer membrane lipoprotein carrier protein LolA [Leifsonia sp. NPDC058194]|uniref:LolA family protein n=1 Tax=Leifsonia sp. NPDC058194 TaxID=3346374 RepID=UPI0036D7BA72